MSLNDLWIFVVELRWPKVHVKKHRHPHHDSLRLQLVGQPGGGTVHATFKKKGHGNPHHEHNPHHKEVHNG